MTNDELKRLQQHWFNVNAPGGKKLGYPDCCIKAFCDQPPEVLRNSKPTKGDKMRYQAGCINGEFTGFIPCIDHAIRILSKEITLESLIKDRLPNLPPFPYV